MACSVYSYMYVLPLLAVAVLGVLSSPKYAPNTHFSQSLHGSNSINSVHPKYQSYRTTFNSSRLAYPSNNVSQSAPTYNLQSSQPQLQKGRPTVRPARFFNPHEDAQKLRYTLQEIANPDVIIGILTNRSHNQRQMILQQYPGLKSDLHKKLSFEFRDLMELLVTPPQTYISQQLKEALKFSTSINEKLLVELLSTLSNAQLQIIKEEYKKMYGRSIHDDMTSFSLNKFTNFFSSYIQGLRDERSWVDHVLATKDAEAIIRSGKLSIANGSPFRSILSFRWFDQVNRTFYEYQRLKHESIVRTIQRDFTGSVRDSVLQVVQSILNRGNYFAEILHENMGSFSKRDATLMRIIVLRSEIDMGDVKDSYGRMYRKSLENDISKNTSGNFKKALLALISG